MADLGKLLIVIGVFDYCGWCCSGDEREAPLDWASPRRYLHQPESPHLLFSLGYLPAGERLPLASVLPISRFPAGPLGETYG